MVSEFSDATIWSDLANMAVAKGAHKIPDFMLADACLLQAIG